jgi:hypothetical protein
VSLYASKSFLIEQPAAEAAKIWIKHKRSPVF